MRGQLVSERFLSTSYFEANNIQLGQCIESCDPAPFEDFLAATEGTIPEDFVPSCADRLVQLSLELPKLRLREKQMLEEMDLITKRAMSEDLLRDAQDANVVLDFWTSTVPGEFLYTSLSIRGDGTKDVVAPGMYPPSLDIYYDHTMASTWNTWRITRIHVLRIIMNCASTMKAAQGIDSEPIEYQAALNKIRQLADEVCSSVPFHLGHHEHRVGDAIIFGNYPHPPGQAKWPDHFAASGAVGGWLMMQPLSFVARLECIPQIQRDWVREYLTTFMRDSSNMRHGPISPPIT